MRNPNPWKPDPKDERIPIGAPDSTVSVDGDGAIVTQAPFGVPDQALMQPFHLIAIQIAKGMRCQVNGMVVKVVNFILRHGRIIGGLGHGGHSYFPKVARSLFFSARVTTTDKRFCQ